MVIYDVQGQKVRNGWATTDAQGEGSFFFEGRDSGGRQVAAGTYQVVVGAGGERGVQRLTVIR